MADQIIQVPADSTGKRVDTSELTVSAQVVQRQRINVADPVTDVALAKVGNAAPASGDYGLTVREVRGAAADPVRVDPTGTTVQPVDVTDEPARDLGKVDIASLDQYTPQDVDTGAPTVNALPVVLKRTAAGAPDFGTSTDPVRIDPTGTTTQPVSATDLDIRNLATGQDKVDARLRNAADAAFIEPATDRTTAAAPFSVRSSDGSAFIEVRGGDVAHDAVDSGNPIKVGGKASGSLPTAVAAADRVDGYFDREGRCIVRPWGAGDWTQVHAPAANTRATTTRTAGAAGVRHVCTGITVVLAAGATAPTAVNLQVRVRDGISDTGTILWEATISLPATAGGMNGITRTGLFIRGTAATAMTLEFSAAGGANTIESVSMEGVDITEA